MTNSMGRVRTAAFLTTAVAALLSVSAGFASAQTTGANGNGAGTDQQSVESVVVTGSSIRGINPVGSNVLTTSQADIRALGSSSTADVLRDLPQVTNLGADDSRSSPGAAQRAISNIAGGTGINLRGIGTEATLTLFDGSRVPPGGGEGRFFDPNSLPLIAIQRIEVVPDGASAIYGSDAVAGVVNLIPVTHYDGASVQLRYGSARGLNQYIAQGIIGTSWDGGGIVAAYEHNQRSDLPTSKRPNQYINSSIYGATSGNTFPANLANNAGPPPVEFTPAGTHQFSDVSGSGTLNTANLAATSANAAGVAGNLVGADALPFQDRDAGYVYAEQNIWSNLKLFARGFYTQRNFQRYGASATTSSLTIPGSSSGIYQNAYNQTVPSVAANYNFIGAIGNTVVSGFERSWQAAGGAELSLGSDWTVKLEVSHGETEDFSRSGNQVNNQALGAAASCQNPTVGPFSPPVTNVTTCNSTATAFDVFSNLRPGTAGFGYPDQNTYQSVVSSIAGYSFNDPTVALTDVTLKGDGSLFDWTGGTVKLAAGGEYQHLTRDNTTGGTIYGPTTSDLVSTPYPTVSRDIESIFVELFVPIVGDQNAMPFVKSLSLDVAGRFDHYHDTSPAITDPNAPLAGLDNTFDTANPKVGVTWQVIDDLDFKGSYGTSFRAPVLGDYALGAPTLGIPFTVTSAVASALGISANCANAGACDMLEIQGGQSNVRPETATTWSFGATIHPSGIPGLEGTLTYYKINYSNQIEVATSGPWQSSPSFALALQSAGLLVANPSLGAFGAFNPTTIRGYLSYGDANAANPVQRYTRYSGLPGYLFAQGILPVSVLVNALSVNSGSLHTDGLDYTLHYTWDSSWGTWTVGDVGTVVLDYDQSLVPGAALVSYVNQINNPLRFQTRGQAGWSNDSVSANAYINYVNAYTNPGIGRVGAYTTVDLALSYKLQTDDRWLANTELDLDVSNLFDTSPPYTINIPNQMAYDPQEASAIGRFVSFQLTHKF